MLLLYYFGNKIAETSLTECTAFVKNCINVVYKYMLHVSKWLPYVLEIIRRFLGRGYFFNIGGG